MTEQIQNDWNTNGQSGDFRDTLGIVGRGPMFAGNTDTNETSADIIKRWSLSPHEKGFAEDIEKISLVPMIEFFKSLGVTHHGYYILGQKPKEYVLMMKSKTNCKPTHQQLMDKIEKNHQMTFLMNTHMECRKWTVLNLHLFHIT